MVLDVWFSFVEHTSYGLGVGWVSLSGLLCREACISGVVLLGSAKPSWRPAALWKLLRPLEACPQEGKVGQHTLSAPVVRCNCLLLTLCSSLWGFEAKKVSHATECKLCEKGPLTFTNACQTSPPFSTTQPLSCMSLCDAKLTDPVQKANGEICLRFFN